MKSFRSMFVILVVCLLGGCSAKIHCWSEESFRSNDFNEEKLEKEGLALLPVIICMNYGRKFEKVTASGL